MKNVTVKIAVILGVFMSVLGFTTYNNLQKAEDQVFNAWSDLDASLQQRVDLAPILVNIAKAYMQDAEPTLDAVTAARTRANNIHLNTKQISDATKVAEYVAAQDELQNSMQALLAAIANYPNLEANQNFLDLQQQLVATEQSINFANQQVNATTRDFNNALGKFSGVVVNKLFLHLQAKEFFKP